LVAISPGHFDLTPDRACRAKLDDAQEFAAK
jgi:hypothetical protein